jgi:hypothetical protein
MFAVMSASELAQVPDPVARAVQANDLMWTNHPDRTALRTLRARAIREALAGGYAAADVADRLGVVVTDLTWMVADSPSWPYRKAPANGSTTNGGAQPGEHPKPGPDDSTGG